MIGVTTWVIHCALIAAVLSAGALAWEVSARWSGRSARWAWLGALAGAVTLPWLLRLVPERTLAEVLPAMLPAISSFAPPAATADASGVAAAGGWSVTQYALAGWLCGTVLMLAYVAYVTVSVMRARRQWRAEEVDGGRVFVTRNVGPAAVGLRQGVVLVPSWALELGAELRSLLLLHEREHVRAGDPRVLFAGVLLVAAMPWNPVLWFALLRLRNAIELDCDARVLARGVSPRAYGALLLEVGRRRSSNALVMATLAEPRLFLEERIRRISKWPLERRPARAFVFALGALVLFTTALSARDPLRPGVALVPAGSDLLAPVPSDTPPRLPTREEVLRGPAFTPMTVRPELKNQALIVQQLVRQYPSALREAGIGGSPTVWLLLDETGRLLKSQISRTSGYPALDEAALRVAEIMEFSAARNGDAPVMVWVEIPIVFRALTEQQQARSSDGSAARTPPPVAPPPPARAAQESTAAQDERQAAAAIELARAGRIDEALVAAQAGIRRGVIDAAVADRIAQQFAVLGFQMTQQRRTAESEPFYAAARQIGTTPRTAAMVDFFHAYTLIKLGEPLIRQSNSADGARAARPLFIQAKGMLDAATAYTEQAGTRAQLMQQVDQFIEVADALIRAGRQD